MNVQRPKRVAAVAILATLAGVTSSCSRRGSSDVQLTGPAYVLTTEGAADDVHDVLLEILQQHMRPVRVVGHGESVVQLGTIEVVMKIHQITYQSSDGKEKASIPRHLRATVTVTSFEGSSNWDGEHQIGFETDAPGSFRDSAKTRRRFARKLLEVAVKQLPGRGAFKNGSISLPAK